MLDVVRIWKSILVVGFVNLHLRGSLNLRICSSVLLRCFCISVLLFDPWFVLNRVRWIKGQLVLGSSYLVIISLHIVICLGCRNVMSCLSDLGLWSILGKHLLVFC